MHGIVRHITLVALVLTVTLARGDEFFFKDGDRVVMIGDSITEQHLYSNYVEMWIITRFPAWDITFRNVGIGGDRSTGGNNRFKRDVLPYKATALTVDFGMNDGGYRAFDEPGFETYLGGLQGMADQAKQAGIRVAWITPQPLDAGDQGPSARTGYNLTLEKYSDGVQAIAKKNGGVFVDQFHPYLASVGQLPDWLGLKLTAVEIEAKRQAAYAERMAKVPELDAAVRKALESKPHLVEIRPVAARQ